MASAINSLKIELRRRSLPGFPRRRSISSLNYLSILKAWHSPEVDRVHFDLKTRDIVINGKSRISYGKGLRAMTRAAFTVGLLEFCRQNETLIPVLSF